MYPFRCSGSDATDVLSDANGSFDLPDAAQSRGLIDERTGFVALTSEANDKQ